MTAILCAIYFHCRIKAKKRGHTAQEKGKSVQNGNVELCFFKRWSHQPPRARHAGSYLVLPTLSHDEEIYTARARPLIIVSPRNKSTK